MKIHSFIFILGSLFVGYGMESEESKGKERVRRRLLRVSPNTVATQTSGVDNFIARWEGEARKTGTWSPALWDAKMRAFRAQHERTMRDLLRDQEGLEERVRILRSQIPEMSDASVGCCMSDTHQEVQVQPFTTEFGYQAGDSFFDRAEVGVQHVPSVENLGIQVVSSMAHDESQTIQSSLRRDDHEVQVGDVGCEHDTQTECSSHDQGVQTMFPLLLRSISTQCEGEEGVPFGVEDAQPAGHMYSSERGESKMRHVLSSPDVSALHQRRGLFPVPIPFPLPVRPRVFAEQKPEIEVSLEEKDTSRESSFFTGKNLFSMALCVALGYALRSLVSSRADDE